MSVDLVENFEIKLENIHPFYPILKIAQLLINYTEQKESFPKKIPFVNSLFQNNFDPLLADFSTFLFSFLSKFQLRIHFFFAFCSEWMGL